MSDKFKIIGIGGAGINSLPSSYLDKSFKINSESFSGFKDLKDSILAMSRTEKTIIISSPAGFFSSYVLPEVCRTVKERGEELIFISIEPFSNESHERRARASETVKGIKKYANTIVRIENDNFASSMENLRWTEMLKKVNSRISELVEGMIRMNDSLPAEKEIGLYHSQGSTIEELQKNLVFSNSRPSEGMVGIADVRTYDDISKIKEAVPVELVSYRISSNLSISGVLLYSHKNTGYTRGIPSEHGIRIH